MNRLGLLLFFVILGIAVYANAGVIQFSDFSDTSSLTLNGDAQTMGTSDGMVLRLTPAEGSRSGSVFSSQTVNASKFSTYFKFRITDPGGSVFDCNTLPGADGIVFVVQSISSDIGSAGGGIGYSGIDTSLGVEFDTWCNSAYNDPNSNHLGIIVNGSVAHDPSVAGATKNIIPDFDNGNIWHAWIDYDGNILETRVSQSSIRPIQPDLQKVVDIPALLGQNSAYIGFTSGTGLDWGNHDIIYWEYRDSYDPIAINENCAQISDNLTMFVPCAQYGPDLLWGEFEFVGSDTEGYLLWRLKDFGLKQ